MQNRSTAELGVSEEAAELFRNANAIDLHVDSFIWNRVFGYDLGRAHRGGRHARGRPGTLGTGIDRYRYRSRCYRGDAGVCDTYL